MIIDGLIIVEGISDVAFLSSFVKAEFMTTGGYTIPKKEIKFAKRVSESKKVIVLTDSDEAGITIRNRINQLIPNLYKSFALIFPYSISAFDSYSDKHFITSSFVDSATPCLPFLLHSLTSNNTLNVLGIN